MKTDTISKDTIQSLIRTALDMRGRAYTPYSRYTVGAALLAKSGTVYTGCNVENAAFTPSTCAERTAFSKAVSEGDREFTAIAIVGGHEGAASEGFAPPCGVCRQVMAEFCEADSFIIILAKSEDEYRVFTLGELLPSAFGLDASPEKKPV